MSTPNGLSFAELKITGDEFVVLQNNTGSAITDLSSYWLQDFNNVNPLANGVSSSSQQLPAVALGAGQTLLLSSVTMPTCGAAIAGKLNVSFTDGGGFLELVQMSQSNGGAVTQTPGDVVSWSSASSGIIQSVPSSTKDPKAVYYRYQNGMAYAWQLAEQDVNVTCQLNVALAGTVTPQPVVSLGQSATSPPAVILSLESDTADTSVPTIPAMPAGDVGLLAPQISELLPNPSGTGTDGTDEFIELYNPNNVIFDLSGFSLQVGTTTLHTWVFPAGSSLRPSSFTAFYSDDTGLSMSNTSGQATLLDPFGAAISQTDTYSSAKDGESWALVAGKWYWTTNTTPGASNIVNQPATASSKTVTKTTTSSTAKSKASTSASKSKAVKGATTNASKATSAGTSSSIQDTAQVTPIHPWTLAVIAVAALLYGAYEYRVDIRNRFIRFRADRAARRVAG